MAVYFYTEVRDLTELQVYSGRKETRLMHYNEPEPGLFLAESLKVIWRALDAGYEPISFLVEKGKLVPGHGEDLNRILSRCPEDLPVYAAEQMLLEEVTCSRLTGGVVCAMKRKHLPDPAGLFASAGEDSIRRIAVLERVVNPTNLGAIVRSAAALGMDAVLFTPDCTDPLYRRAIRVSMGTVFQIPWTFTGKYPEAWYENGVDHLKEMGFHTVAMALRKDTRAIDDPALQKHEKLAVILGTEGDGLAERTIDACDDTVKIPMSHGVDSLNVAAAGAVAFWCLGRS